MKAYRGASAAYSEKMEANPEEIKSVVVHEEVLRAEVVVKTVTALKGLYCVRHLAVGRHRQPKKRTQGNGESRMKSAGARRGLTRCAVPARRKGHGRQGPRKDSIV
jgi:hypothetical protein